MDELKYLEEFKNINLILTLSSYFLKIISSSTIENLAKRKKETKSVTCPHIRIGK